MEAMKFSQYDREFSSPIRKHRCSHCERRQANPSHDGKYADQDVHGRWVSLHLCDTCHQAFEVGAV